MGGIAGIHRARKEGVCVRAAGGAGESWRGLCVCEGCHIALV